MITRIQVTMDRELRRRAQTKAAELGISFAEYLRRVVAGDLGALPPKAEITSVFNLIDVGPSTNIARNKDEMVAEAVWQEHRRKIGGGRRRGRTGRKDSR